MKKKKEWERKNKGQEKRRKKKCEKIKKYERETFWHKESVTTTEDQLSFGDFENIVKKKHGRKSFW